MNKDQFIHPIKQGDVINIKIENGKLISILLESETAEEKRTSRKFT